jgi:hypothetical protein
MDARSVQRSIGKAWRAVDSLDLGAAFANPTSLRVSEEFRDLSLSDDARYEDIYRKGIELAHYNFMLTDYSYFQFSWLGKENVRYAFYPNPFAKAVSTPTNLERLRELEDAGWLTHEEYLAILSERHVANRDPMIRYEHAEGEYRAFHHPCAHLHIGHPPRGRWCVTRALTPYAFTMLILKHQYPREWQSCGADQADATGNVFETALLNERTSLPEIGPAFLSVLEKRTFRLD